MYFAYIYFVLNSVSITYRRSALPVASPTFAGPNPSLFQGSEKKLPFDVAFPDKLEVVYPS